MPFLDHIARFGHDKQERKGKRDCLVCHRERELARYNADVDASRCRGRLYAANHVAEAAERHRRWVRVNPEKTRAKSLLNHQARSLGRDVDAIAYAAILRVDPCAYCGQPAGTIDHIEPIRRPEQLPKGHSLNRWENLTAACQSCNASKRTRSLLHFLVYRQS